MVYINDQYRFLFVENPKCASTTIINAFNKISSVCIGVLRDGPNKCHITCDEKHLKNDACVYCLPQEEFTKGCDVILRVDNLQSDFDSLCKRLHVPTVELNVSNKSPGEYYTSGQVIDAYREYTSQKRVSPPLTLI